MVPPVAVQVMAVFDAPDTVAEKVMLLLVACEEFAGLTADTETVATVTEAEAVTASPAALVTVRV
jgi:hypothetical protein